MTVHKGMPFHSRVIVKYIAFQIPDLLLLIFLIFLFDKITGIPGWLIFIIILLWIIKNIILFPKVWKAYDSRNNDRSRQLIGKDGIVTDELNPVGYIKVMGEYWKAEVEEIQAPVKIGNTVKVMAVNGMKLFVSRLDN